MLSVTHKDALAGQRARPDCHRFLCGPLSALMTLKLRVTVTATVWMSSNLPAWVVRAVRCGSLLPMAGAT